MQRKEWFIVIFPKEKLHCIISYLDRLRQESFWGKIICNVVVLFLSNNSEIIKQAFIELNLLKVNENIDMVFVNDLGIIS